MFLSGSKVLEFILDIYLSKADPFVVTTCHSSGQFHNAWHELTNGFYQGKCTRQVSNKKRRYFFFSLPILSLISCEACRIKEIAGYAVTYFIFNSKREYSTTLTVGTKQSDLQFQLCRVVAWERHLPIIWSTLGPMGSWAQERHLLQGEGRH